MKLKISRLHREKAAYPLIRFGDKLQKPQVLLVTDIDRSLLDYTPGKFNQEIRQKPFNETINTIKRYGSQILMAISTQRGRPEIRPISQFLEQLPFIHHLGLNNGQESLQFQHAESRQPVTNLSQKMLSLVPDQKWKDKIYKESHGWDVKKFGQTIEKVIKERGFTISSENFDIKEFKAYEKKEQSQERKSSQLYVGFYKDNTTLWVIKATPGLGQNGFAPLIKGSKEAAEGEQIVQAILKKLKQDDKDLGVQVTKAKARGGKIWSYVFAPVQVKGKKPFDKQAFTEHLLNKYPGVTDIISVGDNWNDTMLFKPDYQGKLNYPIVCGNKLKESKALKENPRVQYTVSGELSQPIQNIIEGLNKAYENQVKNRLKRSSELVIPAYLRERYRKNNKNTV